MDFRTDILPLKNQLYRLALRITLNQQEAEDVVQDTMVKVWNRRDSWDEIDNIEAFSMTICRNIALDVVKRKEFQNTSSDDMPMEHPDMGGDPLSKLVRKDSLDRIRRAMDSLPENQRTCMQLRDFEGLSYREIAEIVGISEGQVKVTIFRARQEVKKRVTGS